MRVSICRGAGRGRGEGGRVDSPKFHDIRLGQDALHSPPRQLAAVVLHLRGHDGTTLRDELTPPVQGTATALGLAVELVERLDGDKLVLAADGVLLHGVDLGTHDQVDGLLLVGREVEPPVLVGLAGRRVGVPRRRCRRGCRGSCRPWRSRSRGRPGWRSCG